MKKFQMTCVFALLMAATLAAHGGEATPPTKGETLSPPQRAYLALPDADRKAAQEALGWLGFYNGVNDGVPAKRTIDGLRAYQQSLAIAPDGIVTGKLLSALKAGAAKAKAAVGFALIDDAATGIRIGAPLKLLEKREKGAGLASLTSKDGAVGLYLKATNGDLAALYKLLSADAGARKVTYKVLKPGVFFVTSGEEGEAKFYRRYAAQGDKLRGFAFLYPKTRAKALDPVMIAIANSFDPFSAAPLPPAPTPSPTPSPEPPKLTATALIVAPGIAVTALDPAQCKTPTIAGKPAQFLSPQGPLFRLGGEFGAGASAPPVGRGGGDLVALSLAPGAAPVLEASPVQALRSGQVMAAMGGSAPLFDRQGRFVAFVSANSAAPSRAGVAMEAPHATIPAAALGEPTGAQAGPDLTAAEIAALRRAAIVGVFCAS